MTGSSTRCKTAQIKSAGSVFRPGLIFRVFVLVLNHFAVDILRFLGIIMPKMDKKSIIIRYDGAKESPADPGVIA